MPRAETELPAVAVTREARINAMFSRTAPLKSVDESSPFPLFDGGGVFGLWIGLIVAHPSSFLVSLRHRRRGSSSSSTIATTTVPAGALSHQIKFDDVQVYPGDSLTISLDVDPEASPGSGLTIVARVG